MVKALETEDNLKRLIKTWFDEDSTSSFSTITTANPTVTVVDYSPTAVTVDLSTGTTYPPTAVTLDLPIGVTNPSPPTATTTTTTTAITDIKKGNEDSMFDFNNIFEGMFKPIAKGCCKLGMNGQIAIKTNSGYKTFNTKTGRLVNCTNFALDMDNCFWVVPTFKVERGDIVLINGKPRAVLENLPNGSIKAFSYEDSTIDEFVPEHHVFMGKTYCYGKIFCPLTSLTKSDDGMKGMMSMVMMNQMFGNTSNTTSGFNPMMFMFMGKDNPFAAMFEGAFDFGEVPITTEEEE